MSFSDDGWGMNEDDAKLVKPASEVKLGKTSKDEINTAITKIDVGAVPVNSKLNAIGRHEPRTDCFVHYPGLNVMPSLIEKEIERPSEDAKVAYTTDNRSDDGWGAPLRKEPIRAPVVSEATASRLPPSRIQITHSDVPPPVNDTIDIDSPRELSPAPPVERMILPPQVKAASSRGTIDSDSVNAQPKSFGSHKPFIAETDENLQQKASEWRDDETGFLVHDSIEAKKKSICEKQDEVREFKTSGFGIIKKGSGFGGSVGGTSSVGGSNTAVRGCFGGSKSSGFGETKTTGFGELKPTSGYGSTENTDFTKKTTSFGGESIPEFRRTGNKPTYAGGETNTNKNSGFGGSQADYKLTGFGEGSEDSISTGYEKRTTTFKSAGFGGSATFKPSGFGASTTSESNGFEGSTKFGSSNFGGSNTFKSAGFGGSTVSKPTSFGGPTADKPTSFGGAFGSKKQSELFDEPVDLCDEPRNSTNSVRFGSNAKSSNFGDSHKAFGTKQVEEMTGFGSRPEQKCSAFGGFGGSNRIKSGFANCSENEAAETNDFSNKFDGIKSESSTSGFGKQGNTGFGGKNENGFGQCGQNSSKSAFANKEYSSFGGSGQFGNFDGGFDNKQSTNFGDGNRGSGGCRNCGEDGHYARECEQPKQLRPCSNCNELGHFYKDCDKPKVPFGPCRRCGQEGHFSKECTNERVRMEPTEPCRRCGEEGHWGYECPTRPRDLEGNVLVPYDVVFRNEVDMFDEAVNNDDRIDFEQRVVASMRNCDVPDMASFEAFKVLPLDVHDNLKKMKMNRPTPIQRAAFFPILHGHDVVACAHTGSGKTLAFLIPLVINLLEDRLNHHDKTDETPSPRLLIVAPTRELANQTFNTARQLAYNTGLKCGIAYGGYSRSANLQHLRSFDQLGILVATMGRLQDFLEAGEISLAKMKFTVLDEADRMVDSTDFGEEVSKILGPPEQREAQTILFSASFSENLQAEDLPKFVKDGYIMLQVDKFGTANEKIDQRIFNVCRSEKRVELYKLLGIDENNMTVTDEARVLKEKTLIFVNSVKFCDTLASNISSCSVSCISMHSHQNQEQRDRTLEDFRHGKYNCMVASNVCARGLNIAGLDHVINYDMPDKNGFDEYVNRIGRTARAGFTGVSTAFIDEESDREIIPGLVNVLTEAKQEVPEWLLIFNQEEQAAADEEPETW